MTRTKALLRAEHADLLPLGTCKLAEENMMLRKRIQKLESEMQCLAQQGVKLPNQPNQPCGLKEDETDDVY